MANIPSAQGALPGVFTNVITQTSGASVPGGVRIAAIIGTGARSETIVASASGNGNDGLNPQYTSTTGSDGRHFKLNFFPVIANRTQLFVNGVPLVGIEEPIPSTPFPDKYQYALDIETGEIELQQAYLVDQGGSYYNAGLTNIGVGTINSLTLVDDNAPPETWTIKCVSVQRNNLNQPIINTANFVAFGSVSGNVVDQYGNTVVWVSDGYVVTNGILSFGIIDTTVSFREGDYFTVKVSSGVLLRGASLTATYIAVDDINNPQFLSSMPQIQTNYGQVSLNNTLSLGCQLAFANQTPGIMCVEAAPPLPRRISYELQSNFNATSINCEDFIIPLPLGVSPDPNSQIHVFVTNPTTGIETQLLPNQFPFFTLGTAGQPTACNFVFDNTNPPGGNSFSYSVIQENATIAFAQDGYLNASLTSPINATFSSASFQFDIANIGQTLTIVDSNNPANVGSFTITGVGQPSGVAEGTAVISALGTPPFLNFVNIGQTTTTTTSTLPQATIGVTATAGLYAATPSAPGTVYIVTSTGVQTVTYTGTSGGNTLTGCAGGTGAMTNGGAAGNASFELINSLFGTPVTGAAGIASIVNITNTGTATITTSIDLTSYFVNGYQLLIKYPNSPTTTSDTVGGGEPLDSGLFDITGGISSTSFVVSKSFVSEHNLKFEIVDSTQTSDYLVLNHNIVPNGNSLRVTIVDVQDAPFFDAGWELALASLETQEIDILVTLPQQTISVIFQNALNHCLEMSNTLNRKERVLFLGAINGLTPPNLTGAQLAAVESLGVLEGIQGNTVAEILAGDTEDLANYSVSAAYGETYRAVYFFPSQIEVQVGSNTDIIDGFYIAAAAAGYLSGQANVAMPLTNKILSGFTILNNQVFNNATNMQLAAAGVTILQPVAGGGTVLWGLTTTQSGFPQEQEISVVFIRDRIAKSMRKGFAGFIGNPEDNDTQGTLLARATALLNSFITGGLILSWTGLTVEQDAVEPRQWNISCIVTAVEPINWIYITVGVN